MHIQDYYCRLVCDNWPCFSYFLKKTLQTIIQMPPLCNYNNNHDDDFATENAIQGAYTQLLFSVFSCTLISAAVVAIIEEWRDIFLLRVTELLEKK